MYLHFTPIWIQKFLPSFTYRKIVEEKVIFITFDDGPIPEVTPWVLETLAQFNAKATFFCVGENISKHTTIFKSIISAGHAIGNHTYHHLKGLKNSNERYLKNIIACEQEINSHHFNNIHSPKLFRPPHGRLSFAQAKNIKAMHYEIILWNVLSGDFDIHLSKEKCLSKTLQYTQKVAIVVFHDNIKSFEKLQYVLPRYLQALSAQGYTFHTL